MHTCAHFCCKMVHCGIWDWCIVEFVMRWGNVFPVILLMTNWCHCLTAPSNYLNQCWRITNEFRWHSHEVNFKANAQNKNQLICMKMKKFKLKTKSRKANESTPPQWFMFLEVFCAASIRKTIGGVLAPDFVKPRGHKYLTSLPLGQF